MKLPDYGRCVEINQLLVAMGVSKIPTLPEVKFERTIVKTFVKEEIDKEDIEIGKRLIEGAIPVSRSELVGLPGELLEYKGRKVVAYIRDQKAAVDFYQKRSEYRFHLCNCKTLQSMKEMGREHRYLTTQRSDGFFEVYDLTDYTNRKGVVRMDLCKNCIEILKYKGLYSRPFDLRKYFSENDSYVPKTIRRKEEVREVQTYSPKQADYSRKYRKACHYKCQLCGIDCANYHSLLHLHHKDADPSNNKRENLQVLCVDCHSKQPLHGQLLRNPTYRQQINIINNLRRKQGILHVN